MTANSSLKNKKTEQKMNNINEFRRSYAKLETYKREIFFNNIHEIMTSLMKTKSTLGERESSKKILKDVLRQVEMATEENQDHW